MERKLQTLTGTLQGMMRFLKHTEIDKKKWDACVTASGTNLPYAFSWFLDISAEQQWDGLVLNNYEAVMPLPWKRKLGIKLIYQPFFVQQLGVYGNGKAAAFVAAIPPEFRHIHTLLNYENKTVLKEKGTKEEINLILPLNKNYESIHKNYSENCRRNIKKAQKLKLHIAEAGPKKLISIFRNTQGKKLPHLKEKNYRILGQLMDELNARGLATTSGVYTESKKLLGGMTMISFQNRCIFFFSAQSEEGRAASVNNFLIDYFIQQNAGSDVLLDFEGSNSTSLARFYRGFGAQEQNYFSYSSNKLPALLKLLKK